MSAVVTTLYSDSAKTNALYPRTKASAVSDNDGNSLGNLAVCSYTVSGNEVQMKDASGNNIYPVIATQGIEMDLLWTNSNTYSQGAGSTDVSLADYDFVGIVTIRYNNETGNTFWNYCPVGEKIRIASNDGGRTYTTSTTAVSWEAGTNNAFIIPYKIYGIKV